MSVHRSITKTFLVPVCAEPTVKIALRDPGSDQTHFPPIKPKFELVSSIRVNFELASFEAAEPCPHHFGLRPPSMGLDGECQKKRRIGASLQIQGWEETGSVHRKIRGND